MASTSTLQSFSAMLNEFLPTELLREDLVRRNWYIQEVEKINNWKGGNLVVPFKGGQASSVQYGNLPAESDVAEDTNVRGGVSGYKELWGTMLFNERDLMEHDKISEQSLIKMLPDSLDDFMEYFKEVVSVNILNGGHFAILTANGDASGNITVDRPDRFQLKQKVLVVDDDTSAVTGYVQAINVNSGVINLDTTRAGGTDANFGSMTVAANAKCYHPGAEPASALAYTSCRAALLSAANGGGSTIYGVAKTLYPYTQAINVDGSSMDASNIMEKIFDAVTTTRRLAKGKCDRVVMSYKNFGSVLKVIEASKGSFNVMPGSQKASQYGWDEIVLGAVARGPLKIVAVQELDDDIIYLFDMRGHKFYSNGFFRKRVGPDGLQFHTIRATSGYQYLVDWTLFGELVIDRPSYQGVIYGISY